MAGKDTHTDAEAAFAARLREVRQQKNKIEEEFEDASERWRKERRRLNDEIERLDQELQKSRSTIRKVRSSEDPAHSKLGARLEESEQLRAQAEAALGESRAAWESEREGLRAKVRQLEEKLVEALERSSNPVRAGQAQAETEKVEFEGRIAKVEAAAKEELEAALAGWEAEKGKLHLEIDRLKRAAVQETTLAPPAPPAPESESRSSRGWLSGKLRGKSNSEKGPEAAGAEPTELRDKLAAAEQSRDEMVSRVRELETTASEAQDALRKAESEHADLTSRVSGLTTELEAARAALVSKSEPDPALGRELSETKGRLEEALQSLREIQEEKEAVEKSRDGQATRLQALEAAAGKAEAERVDLTSRVSELTTELEAARALVEAKPDRDPAVERDLSDTRARLKETGLALRQVQEQKETAEKELQGQVEALSSRLEKANRKIEELQQSVSNDAARIDPAELEAVREELLSKLSESEKERTAQEKRSGESAGRWAVEKAELERRLEEARRQHAADVEQIERDLREKLTLEYEFRIKELNYQKEQVEERLQTALATDAADTGSGRNEEDVAAELKRVDEQIAEIAAFIEDPGSSLTSVIRKNVERSELEAYRRGLSFQGKPASPKKRD